jgi:hypothetical protein
MRFHALEGASIETTVTVQNFELWHLGLLAYVFQDFKDGLVALGFGKSKGFGQVRGSVERVTLSYPRGKAAGKLHHLGSLASAEERVRYGFQDREPPACELTRAESRGVSYYESFAVKDLEGFWRSAAEAFNAQVEASAGAAGG